MDSLQSYWLEEALPLLQSSPQKFIEADVEGTRLWKQHIYPLFKKTKTSPSAETMNLMFQETYKILETVALHLKRHSSSNSSSRAVSWHAALSHLGDLHRYHLSSSINSAAGGDVNHLRFLKTASFDFYREASLLSPNNGLYLSQMGSVVFLTASTSVMNNDDRGVSPFMDHVVACYYFSRSLCVASPFKSAKESLSLLLRSSSSVSSTNALQLFLAITEYIYFSINVDKLDSYISRLLASFAVDRYPAPLIFQLSVITTCLITHTTTTTSSSTAPKQLSATDLMLIKGALNLHNTLLSCIITSSFSQDIADNPYLPKSSVAASVHVLLISLVKLLESAAMRLPSYLPVSTTIFTTFLGNKDNSNIKTILAFVQRYTASISISSSTYPPYLFEEWELKGFTPTLSELRQPSSKLIPPLLDHSQLLELSQKIPKIDQDFADRSRCIGNLCQRLTRVLNDEKVIAVMATVKSPIEPVAVVAAATTEKSIAETDIQNRGEEEEEEKGREVRVVGRGEDNFTFEATIASTSQIDLDMARLQLRKRELSNIVSSSSSSSNQTSSSSSSTISNHHQPPPLPLNPASTLLVFDTNYFISHLKDIQLIVDQGVWNVRVPLVVVAELEGLAKGAASATTIKTTTFDGLGQSITSSNSIATTNTTNANTTSVNAQRSVEFLEQVADKNSRNSKVMFMTVAGSLLPNLVVRSENWGSINSRNAIQKADDVLLRCCQILRQQQRSDGGAGQPVVLVTRDVNLRLKARTRGVAVVDNVATLKI